MAMSKFAVHTFRVKFRLVAGLNLTAFTRSFSRVSSVDELAVTEFEFSGFLCYVERRT